MSHVQSNQTFTHPCNKNLKVPETLAEFQSLNYLDRLQLQQEHPAVYRRFQRLADRQTMRLYDWEE